MRVYISSPWIPPEWIQAHGIESRGIWSENLFFREALPLSAGVCPFAELLACCVAKLPESAVIFTTACDQMRRSFDAASFRGHSRIFLFNLPATHSQTAKQLFRSELERLSHFLQGIGGCIPTPETLHRKMECASEVRQCLLDASESSTAQSFACAVAQYHRDGTLVMPQPVKAANTIPLALVGGPMSEQDWSFVDAIEAAGGRVVLNATETGERSLYPAFDLGCSNKNPFDTLVEGCFNHMADVFQRPNDKLYAWLKPRILSRHVRGIVLWHFTGCDLWRAEASTMREAFGLPVLLLEPGAEPGTSPRDITRIQAFLEALQ